MISHLSQDGLMNCNQASFIRRSYELTFTQSHRINNTFRKSATGTRKTLTGELNLFECCVCHLCVALWTSCKQQMLCSIIYILGTCFLPYTTSLSFTTEQNGIMFFRPFQCFSCHIFFHFLTIQSQTEFSRNQVFLDRDNLKVDRIGNLIMNFSLQTLAEY